MMDDRHDESEPRADRSAQGAGGTTTFQLAELLYGELRNLARTMMANRAPGTLQPTALVHEAYIRLAHKPGVVWDHPGHFFGAAARAMRNILVDERRRKSSKKHGGDLVREELDEADIGFQPPPIDLLALDGLLDELETRDPQKYWIVMLRYFAGLSSKETAAALGISLRTVEREWTFTRTYLYHRLTES